MKCDKCNLPATMTQPAKYTAAALRKTGAPEEE